ARRAGRISRRARRRELDVPGHDARAGASVMKRVPGFSFDQASEKIGRRAFMKRFLLKRETQNSKLETGVLANERGAALIIVLWIFIFLFVVAFDFSASVREEGMATHRYAEETEGYYLALAGFQQGIYEVLRQFAQARSGNQSSTDMFESNWKQGTLGDGV